MKILRSNITSYITLGISLLIALTSYAFVDKTSTLKESVEKVELVSSSNAIKVSKLEADNQNMKEWLSRVENKLDRVIAN